MVIMEREPAWIWHFLGWSGAPAPHYLEQPGWLTQSDPYASHLASVRLRAIVRLPRRNLKASFEYDCVCAAGAARLRLSRHPADRRLGHAAVQIAATAEGKPGKDQNADVFSFMAVGPARGRWQLSDLKPVSVFYFRFHVAESFKPSARSSTPIMRPLR